MITTPVVGNASSGGSRRMLYRHTKRMLLRLLARRWRGPRIALEPAVRRFLRARPRGYLVRLVGDRPFALAVARRHVRRRDGRGLDVAIGSLRTVGHMDVDHSEPEALEKAVGLVAAREDLRFEQRTGRMSAR